MRSVLLQIKDSLKLSERNIWIMIKKKLRKWMDRVILRFVYFSVDHPLLWEMQQHNIMHHHETEGISTSVE